MTSKTKLPDTSGIYMIRSQVNGKRYIGSAVNLRNRKAVHFCSLRKNDHGNIHMQRHYNKHGEADLQISIMELCTKEKLIKREQYYIDTLNPRFNILKVAGSRLGCIISEAHKRKLLELRTGSKHSEETKRKMSKVHKGRKLSEKTKKKIGKANKGRKQTAKHIEANRKSHIGMKHSEETKRKMSESAKGRIVSEESKRKMSKAQKGKIISKETRRKIGKANKGNEVSKETRKKLSEANKGKNNAMYGIKHSKESKRKMSIARISYLKREKHNYV